MSTKTFFIIWGMVLAVFVIYFVYALYYRQRVMKMKSKEIGTRKNSTAHQKNTFLFVMYRVFTTAPFIKRYFRKVLRKTQTLYPSDMLSVNKRATKIMLKALLVMFACIIGGIIVSGSDLYYIFSTILTSFLIFNMMITAGFEQMETRLLNQFIVFLSNVRHNYHETKIVEDAIYNTLETSPFEVSLHITKIHDVITSPYMDEKVSEYIDSSPNRYFLTFVSICASIKDYGDKDLENGSSLFLTNLNYLKEEINMELLKKSQIKSAFALLEIITLVPVMTLKLIEMWAISSVPELSTTYAGRYGIITMTIIFAVTILCYLIIRTCRNTERAEIKEKTIWVKISNMDYISPVLNKIINKDYGKTLKINEKLKLTGDHTGTKAFLAKRFVYAVLTLVLTTLLFFTSDWKEKIKVINDYENEFDEAIVPNDAYLDIMLHSADEFSQAYKGKKITEADKQKIVNEIIHQTEVKNENYAYMVMESVVEHVDNYNNVYYRWYYLVISVILSIMAFFAPLWFLNFKVSILKMAREDEINQFNTLMLILMYADGVTVELILEWLERFAYCFKPSISECLINLSHGEKQALEKMKANESYLPFKQFVDGLISIDEIGVQSAFDEIKTDRDYYKEKRKQDNITQVKKRAFWAKFASYVPLFAVIGLYIIIPMGIMALKMFSTMNLSF